MYTIKVDSENILKRKIKLGVFGIEILQEKFVCNNKGKKVA